MARKRKPQIDSKALHTHRGQIGLPTPERAQHMPDGFEVRQLSAGFSREGGVIQSRQVTILTHPALLSELYNAVIQQHQARGEPLPHHVDVNRTPADRATAQHRGILWSYISARIDAIRGNIKIVSYEGAGGSYPGSRLPLPEREFVGRAWDRRRFYAWVREQSGMAYLTDFLDRVVAHDNPGLDLDADTIITKHDIGRALLAKDVVCPNESCRVNFGPRAPRSGFCRHCGSEIRSRDRDAENAFYGALSFAANILGEAARDFVTWENRRRMVGSRGR
jgi:hypothetical protein